jgi:hypothetical protein
VPTVPCTHGEGHALPPALATPPLQAHPTDTITRRSRIGGRRIVVVKVVASSVAVVDTRSRVRKEGDHCVGIAVLTTCTSVTSCFRRVSESCYAHHPSFATQLRVRNDPREGLKLFGNDRSTGTTPIGFFFLSHWQDWGWSTSATGTKCLWPLALHSCTNQKDSSLAIISRLYLPNLPATGPRDIIENVGLVDHRPPSLLTSPASLGRPSTITLPPSSPLD